MFVLFDNFSQARTVIVIGFIQLTTIAWVYGKHSLIYLVSPFVFCPGDCPFKSEPTPTSADACGEGTDCDAGCQKVSRCSNRGRSWEIYITFASAKQANKAEPTLVLKPREEVTRNPKQGYQWPRNKTHVSTQKQQQLTFIYWFTTQCNTNTCHYS